MMIPMELRKNPNFLSDLEHQCIKTHGYSQELFELAKSLVSYDPRERPNAEKTIRAINKIRAGNKYGDLKLALKDFHSLPERLKLEVFSYLKIEDMYHVGLTCRQYFSLWDEQVSDEKINSYNLTVVEHFHDQNKGRKRNCQVNL